MAGVEIALQIVEEPTPEPILVEWESGGRMQHAVIEPEDPGWLWAYLWRERTADFKNAERDLAAKRAQITKLQRGVTDAAKAERKAHPDRDFIGELFDKWRELTNKTRCKLTPARFDMAADRLAEAYEREHLTLAVYGVALAPYTVDGEVKNDWKTCMWDGEAVERYANRCPAEKRNEIRGTLFEVVGAVAA